MVWRGTLDTQYPADMAAGLLQIARLMQSETEGPEGEQNRREDYIRQMR